MFGGGDFDGFSGGSFWGNDGSLFGASSAIEDILDRDKVFLEDILEEQSAIQEAKALNDRLIGFLKQEETLTRLVQYVVCTSVDEFRSLSEEARLNSEGDGPLSSLSSAADQEAAQAASLIVDASEGALLKGHESDEERAIKYPFVACEIICCNVTDLIAPLVKSERLLGILFGKLDSDAQVEPRLAGYLYKILTILLRRAPERILWYSIHRNVTVSEDAVVAGKDSDSTTSPGWLIRLLLRHIGSYSIMCCFKAFLQVAADGGALVLELEEEDDENDSGSFTGFGAAGAAQDLVGDLDDRPPVEDRGRSARLQDVRAAWLGGSGTAEAVLEVLAGSDNSDAHNNAAEILADMIQRAAMTRLSLQAGSEASLLAQVDATLAGSADELPCFRGLILRGQGRGPAARMAMVESGCAWTLSLSKQLLQVALFEPSVVKSDAAADEDDMERVVARGSAAVASLRVLTHLVGAFALERWSAPGAATGASQSTAHMTSAEAHGDVPPELQAILDHLPDLVDCLGSSAHAALLGISEARAERSLGVHRLKIVELVSMLVHSKYPAAIAAVAAYPGAIPRYLDLFFQFEWNNCLHAVVERTLQFVFLGGVSEASMGLAALPLDTNGVSTARGDDDVEEESGVGKLVRLRQAEIAREQRAASKALLPMQQGLFGTGKLVDRLLDAYAENQAALSETEAFWSSLEEGSPESPRRKDLRTSAQKGYIGHCHRIVNTIVLVAASQRNEREAAVEASGEHSPRAQPNVYPALAATEGNERWISLLQEEITEVNAIEQCVLGGMTVQQIRAAGPASQTDDLEDMDGDLVLQHSSVDVTFEADDFDTETGFDHQIMTQMDGDDSDEDEGSEDDFDILAAESTASDTDDDSDALAGQFSRQLHLGRVVPPVPPPLPPLPPLSSAGEAGENGDDDDFDPFGEAKGNEDLCLPSSPSEAAAGVAVSVGIDDDDEFDPFGIEQGSGGGTSQAPTKAAQETQAGQDEWDPFA